MIFVDFFKSTYKLCGLYRPKKIVSEFMVRLRLIMCITVINKQIH